MNNETSALTDLSLLHGAWEGEGLGGYPTIDSFRYREMLDVSPIPGSASLHYVQRTVLVDDQGQVLKTSHWETGVVRPLADGQVELACVHVNARYELLTGNADPDGHGGLALVFESVQIGNDPRMRSSSRTWTISPGQWQYKMTMATDRVGQPTLHLEARLRRAEAR